MELFGNKMNKREVLEKIGDISQLGWVKCYQFTDGLGKGIRAVDIKSSNGLDMTILLDRGMDISYLSYKSVPISWRSVTRETSPIFYESQGMGMLRTFFGGLLTTCGLSNIGYPCTEGSEEFGLHGRISNLSAQNVWADGKWEADNYVMFVQGKIREVMPLGDKLELSRKITTWMSTPKIIIEDTVENIGSKESPLMILYHINIGYPLLDSSSILLFGKTKTTSQDEQSKKGLDNFYKFGKPVQGYKDEVFYHDIKADKEGNVNVAIVNPDFNNNQGLGLWVKFNKNNLPYLIQWKNLNKREYVCGLEPANSFLRGRNVEREKEFLKFIKTDEKINYKLELNILNSNDEIEKYKSMFC